MFGSDGGTTLWPHIQVNTLRREKDIPVDKLLPPIQLPTETDTTLRKAAAGPAPIVCPMGHKHS
ncbi:hypothetical protein ACFO3O_19150 [Dokdonia ponticola]|uniref:Uncharacterized protein n=1 Tax=Dokdonia ponticola TaxID=2041041 RepID=A0ABV9I452_9FLAO